MFFFVILKYSTKFLMNLPTEFIFNVNLLGGKSLVFKENLLVNIPEII